MSNNCRDNNLLQRDGTSRQQRLLKALLPGYVAVDERKIEDLISFVRKYARQVRFYPREETGGDLENWENFFEKELDPGQRTEPHYALFLAFLQLFRIAQDDLNQITRKHLEFYYRDVLRLDTKEAVADQAYIILELARHVDQHLIEKGTQLKAGKDDSGKELIYKTDRDIVINTATVEEIKAVFRDENSRLYASPIADSADGQGAEIESTEMNWRTFGRPAGKWKQHERPDRPQAEIGFAFASPLLFLAEGDREITITLTLKETEATGSLTELLKGLKVRDAFRVRFSGEEDWIEPLAEENDRDGWDEVPAAVVERILDFLNSAETWEDIAGVEPQEGPVSDDPERGYGDQINDYDIGETTAKEMLRVRDKELGPAGFASLKDVREVRGVGKDKIDDLIYTFRNPCNTTTVDPESRQIIIKRTVTKAQDPIVAYRKNDKKLLDPFTTRWPVVKITLNTDQDPYIYETLEKLAVKHAHIAVQVSELRELTIQNDQSVLDPGKNFHPFGIRPEQGSNVYVGSREVFSKNLERLKVHVSWHGLPDDFEDYYLSYDGPERSNDSFKANVYLLDKKNWVPLQAGEGAGPGRALDLFSEDAGMLSENSMLIVQNREDLRRIPRDPGLGTADEYDTDTRKGFLRLELANTDFGHKDYQSAYSKAVLGGFQKDGTFDSGTKLPSEPYTPEVKGIYINYRSSVEMNLDTDLPPDDAGERAEQIFHVGVFGTAEKTAENIAVPLLPKYASEGALYIGIDNFSSGQTLSLLFQVAEGSADPDLEPQEINWSYLSRDQWVDFDKFGIQSDGTSGLLTSGIIHFDISKEATDQNTLLPPGKHWIRAAVTEKSDAVSDLVKIIAQAVPVIFKDQDNDPDHLRDALPAGTIAKLKVADSAIDEIQQPFSSFGGEVREQKNAFYTRVSERLRHKNRAVTIWDYERLVLGTFSSVYKVKCLNHTRYTGKLDHYSEIAPGHVTLVVISNVRNKNAVDPLRPKTSLITLTEIEDFMSELNSVGVDLHVKNPIYEEIQVELNVKFYEEFDNGFYGKKLEDDLKSFLSPWAFESASELVLGGKIHKSVILNFVEERPYVDFVTCFDIYHIVKNPGTDAVVSKTKVNEAVASTSVSILGSVGDADRYGDHNITVLETGDCECGDNEIKPTASIASTDDCTHEDQMFET